VRVQMLVLFAVFPIGARFRSTLEMDRESVPADARIEPLIYKVAREAKLVTVVANRAIKIIDQKLRGYPSKARSLMNCHCRHSITSWPGNLLAGTSLESTMPRRRTVASIEPGP